MASKMVCKLWRLSTMSNGQFALMDCSGVRNCGVIFCVRKKSSSSARMAAWQIHQYGEVNELTLNKAARACAIKSPNELLVKVNAASVNPIDVRMMGGYGQALLNVLRKQKGVMKGGTEFPLTFGRDFSGTVIETGGAVRRFSVGDQVWGALSAERPGTHAEYVVTSQDEISRKPSNISHVEAASLPYVAATTWAALCTVGELRESKTQGKRVLVFGGSGGVGTFAIQLLKAWGAHVTTTCSTDAVAPVQALGVDEVIDYRTSNVWTELRRMEKFDLILDTLGGETTNQALPLLSPWRNSKLVTVVTPMLRNSDNLGLIPGVLKTAVNIGVDTLKGLKSGGSVRWAVFMPSSTAMERVRQMVEAHQIKPVVQEIFPFQELPHAFQKVKDGHLRGKIVIEMSNP